MVQIDFDSESNEPKTTWSDAPLKNTRLLTSFVKDRLKWNGGQNISYLSSGLKKFW